MKLESTLKILLLVTLPVFSSFHTFGQCRARYIALEDSILLIQTNLSEEHGNGSLRDHYLDDDFGDIFMDISTGLFVKAFDTRYMSFVVVVNIAGFTNKRHFKTTQVEFEFTDHTGFKLKTDTLIFSSRSDSIKFWSKPFRGYFDMRVFYMNSITFTYLLKKPLYRISLIDDVSLREINLFPDRYEIRKQSECLPVFIPKETTVEYYSRVMDSLMYTKKYGNMGK